MLLDLEVQVMGSLGGGDFEYGKFWYLYWVSYMVEVANKVSGKTRSLDQHSKLYLLVELFQAFFKHFGVNLKRILAYKIR